MTLNFIINLKNVTKLYLKLNCFKYWMIVKHFKCLIRIITLNFQLDEWVGEQIHFPCYLNLKHSWWEDKTNFFMVGGFNFSRMVK